MLIVSCVMPTWNRREFVPAAIRCYQEQTYPARELVILDDGNDGTQALIPRDDPSIRYIRLPRKAITGEKRNLVNAYSRGELIAHWDDDDWSAPERLSEQAALLKGTGKAVTGYYSLLFWDTFGKAGRVYQGVKSYACGTTFLYRREFWRRRPFAGVHEASDNTFLQGRESELVSVEGGQMMVARLHGRHTSGKSNIKTVAPLEMFPDGFFTNEQYRLSLV